MRGGEAAWLRVSKMASVQACPIPRTMMLILVTAWPACGINLHEPPPVQSRLTTLESEAGQRRLQEAGAGAHFLPCVQGDGQSCAQAAVLDQWRRQRNKASCGPTSLAIVLSSLQAAAAVDEDDVLPRASARHAAAPDPRVQAPPAPAEVSRNGMTLEELEATAVHLLPDLDGQIAGAPPGGGRVHSTWRRVHAAKSRAGAGDPGEETITSVKELRAMVVETLALDGRIIANYDMSTLGQTPYAGHHSPV